MSEEYEAETRLEESRRLHDEHTKMLCDAHAEAITHERAARSAVERDLILTREKLEAREATLFALRTACVRMRAMQERGAREPVSSAFEVAFEMVLAEIDLLLVDKPITQPVRCPSCGTIADEVTLPTTAESQMHSCPKCSALFGRTMNTRTKDGTSIPAMTFMHTGEEVRALLAHAEHASEKKEDAP